MRRLFKRGRYQIFKFTFYFAVCLTCVAITGCGKSHQHKTVHMDKVEATCTKEGQKEYWKCLGCDQIFSDAAAKNEISKQDILITKKEHLSIDDAAVLPTCETTGLTAGTHCSYCDLVLLQQETVPKLGHLYDVENGRWVWDEFEKASLRLICKNDVNHIIDYEAEIRSEPRGPTCLNPGETIYTASVVINGITYVDSKKEVLLPIEHEFDLDHIIWIWDKDETAIAQISCKLDSTHSLNIHAEITHETIEATCTDKGKEITTATIIIDGTSYTDQKEEEIPAIGHAYDYNHLVWSWENYASAKAVVRCTHNPLHFIEYNAEITPLTTPATCTTDGRTLYTATVMVDDKSYQDQKEEILPALGHNYDYHQPVWLWDGFERATIQFSCKNDATHTDEYDATIEEITTPSTCIHQGNISYIARSKVNDYNYTYEKSVPLPLDETNHEFQYEHIEWIWTPIVDGYQARASVQCDCGEIQSEEAIIESTLTPSTFEQTGNIHYVAYAFDLYSNYYDVVLPIKQYVSTEEQFLEAIQANSYDLTLNSDIVLTEGARIAGDYANIDLNGYTMSMPNYSLTFVATQATIRNGYLFTDLETSVGSYVIGTDKQANVLIEDLITLGGINIWNANAIIRNCDVTATFYYAVCAQGEAKVIVESGAYRKNFISNCANTFFWIEGAGIDEGIEFVESEMIIKNGVELFTTTNATLYNTDGITPKYDETPIITCVNVKDYLASNLDFKCLSLTENLIYSPQDSLPQLNGKKIVLDLEGHTLTVPEGILHFSASLVRVRNGYINLDTADSDYVLSIENKACALLDNLGITGGIEVKTANVTIKNVTLNATNSYAIHSSQGSEVNLIVDPSISFIFQPKLTATKVIKNNAGNDNAYYFIEEGSNIYLNSIVHETTTEALLYDPQGISPIEINST